MSPIPVNKNAYSHGWPGLLIREEGLPPEPTPSLFECEDKGSSVENIWMNETPNWPFFLRERSSEKKSCTCDSSVNTRQTTPRTRLEFLVKTPPPSPYLNRCLLEQQTFWSRERKTRKTQIKISSRPLTDILSIFYTSDCPAPFEMNK